jgi:hypothetical protein
MPENQPPFSSLFGQVDVTAGSAVNQNAAPGNTEVLGLLGDLVTSQERQNELLEELIQQMSAAQRQRANEMGQWKQANPELAKSCRLAAESLSKVQTTFLENLTEDIADSENALYDSDFMLNEFVDRYGPRLAHLNGVLQVLTQLSSAPK